LRNPPAYSVAAAGIPLILSLSNVWAGITWIMVWQPLSLYLSP